MRYNELFEDVAADVAAEKKASQAYRLMSNFALSQGITHEVSLWNMSFFGFTAKECGIVNNIGTQDFIILIGTKSQGNTQKRHGSICDFSKSNMQFKLGIILYYADAPTEEAAIKAISSTSFMGTFKHEFIHLLDFERGNFPDSAHHSDAGDTAGYYNNPSEFNAYYHDIASNWASAVAELRDMEPGEDRRDMAHFYGITGNFNADLKYAVHGEHALTFMKHLTADRRKRILKRLFALHKEACAVAFEEPKVN